MKVLTEMRVFCLRNWLSSGLESLRRGCALVAALVLGIAGAGAADSFVWQTNKNLVTADISSGQLQPLLRQIAASTGWQIFLDPGTTHAVSARFHHLPPGQTPGLLPGELHFALVPQTNASPKLLLFHTTIQRATLRVEVPADAPPKLIRNELIVRPKPGAKTEDIARQLGAKVVGKI